MVDSDNVTLHKETVKIEGDRDLHNYTFEIRQSELDDLIRLVESGDAQRVRQYLDAHPSAPMREDGHPFTPLHFAAKIGSAELIRMLVEKGAVLDVEDGEHQSTPLGWAAFFGRPAAAEELLRLGAPVTENSLENARAGIDGRLSEIADASPDDYRAVLALLENPPTRS
jgi:ankyrin repeat protein